MKITTPMSPKDNDKTTIKSVDIPPAGGVDGGFKGDESNAGGGDEDGGEDVETEG